MSDWPDTYDFRSDETCQAVFKPFILAQLKELEAYDRQRPAGHTYISMNMRSAWRGM